MNPLRCDFCDSSHFDILYKPIKTQRGVDIAVCRECGLVFSIYSDQTYNRTPNPSGDADWGNIRWAKGFRLEAVSQMLSKFLNENPIQKVLDVGSNRGDFTEWIQSQYPDIEVTAVEPDERVVSRYCGHRGVDLHIAKLEDVSLSPDTFDFVYCCQTLEHAASAASMLKQIHKSLKPGGTLFLEVPNIEVIHYPLTVEEFFIDKHSFHFNHSLLCSYVEWIGFKLEHTNPPDDFLNVRLLATKSSSLKNEPFTRPLLLADLPDRNQALIDAYGVNIRRNRDLLPAVVSKIHHLMDRMKVALWGATTIFDLLVKYGGLETNRVSCLVDQYVYKYLPVHSGVPVQSPTVLRTYQPDTCIVLARFSSNEIEQRARRFGVRNVIKFSDLLEAAGSA